MDELSFAPPFRPQEALLTLKRSLRDLRLTERGNGFEWKAQRIVEFELAGQQISVRLAKRPLASPEFDHLQISSSAALRKLTDDIKLRLSRWSDE